MLDFPHMTFGIIKVVSETYEKTLRKLSW